MKIAHIADAHWGLNYPGPTPRSRFDDITRTMNWAADRIIAEKCDLVLFAGDAFKDARVFIDRASIEIKAFTDWLRKISAVGIEVIVISGTPSHDAIPAYEIIREMRIHRVSIRTTPDVLHFESMNDAVDIACLPGLNRSNIVSNDEYKGMQPHEVHQIMTEKLTQICRGLLSKCDYEPAILLSHMTYCDADKGFEDLLMQSEPVLTHEAVEGFDLVTLGHIHRPQQNGKVFYCGSPERLTFNDENISPGFWIHKLNQEECRSQFIETPARYFYRFDLTEDWIKKIIEDPVKTFAYGPWLINNNIVRIKYNCSEDIAKMVDRKKIESALYDAGAFYVQEIKADIQRVERARDREVTETLGPVEAIGKWGQNQEIIEEEIAELQLMTTELLEEVATI